MKKFILAAAMLAVGATAATAQYGGGPRPDQRRWVAPPPPPVVVWKKTEFPYGERMHRVCVRKAWELREFDRHAAADGWFSPRERRTHVALKADLDRTCGGYRWRG